MSNSVSSRPSDVVSMLLVDATASDRASIAPHLGAYPSALLERLVGSRCRIRPLKANEHYRELRRRCGPFWGHVNPYGRYELDMGTRLPLSA